jgi:iron-sulfur cluster assembly accessory protein
MLNSYFDVNKTEAGCDEVGRGCLAGPVVAAALVEAGGCSGFEYGMSFDEKKDDDQLFEDNGVEFLVDETSLEYLDDSVVDFDDGLTGKGFEVRNPNASSTCGCGRSFN